MKIGVLADTHDHLDNLRTAVEIFNHHGCELVAFAGDFVSPIVGPTFRKLHAPLIACFGDNEGNQIGIQGGLSIVGKVGIPPLGFETRDGTRILLTHMLEDLRGMIDGADIIIYAHTHKPRAEQDRWGRLFLNPGETSGWTYRKPTVAILETTTKQVDFIRLDEMASPVS